MQEPDKQARFAQAVLPHLDVAYNLARWLTRDEHDAEDVVQEAYLRAYKFFDGAAGDRRAWLLAIVRNTCYTWLKQNRPREAAASFNEAVHGAAGAWSDPVRLLDLEQAYPGGPGGWEFRKNSKSFGVFRGFKRCVDSSTPGPTRDFE